MLVYFYISDNFKSAGKLTKVFKFLDYGKFYCINIDDGLINLANDLNLTVNLVNKKDLYKVLRAVDFILIFATDNDKFVNKLIRYSIQKGRNLILIPDEETAYLTEKV